MHAHTHTRTHAHTHLSLSAYLLSLITLHGCAVLSFSPLSAKLQDKDFVVLTQPYSVPDFPLLSHFTVSHAPLSTHTQCMLAMLPLMYGLWYVCLPCTACDSLAQQQSVARAVSIPQVCSARVSEHAGLRCLCCTLQKMQCA